MAPFVELEWGKEAADLMRKIKRLFDPENLLNPGVILNDNPHAHLENLKPMPAAEDIVDRCIECGFCEPLCPSHRLTLSPRQRIVSVRELSRRAAAMANQPVKSAKTTPTWVSTPVPVAASVQLPARSVSTPAT
jgi:D-lactate dehydrogenase